MAAHREAIQKQIHQDWANREYIEVITASIKRITDFLNSFGIFSTYPVLFSVLNPHCVSLPYRHVLSVQVGPVERETDDPGAENRLLGKFRDEGRSTADLSGHYKAIPDNGYFHTYPILMHYIYILINNSALFV